MRYADLINNDIANGNDVCVSLWLQGCPHRCVGCHNPTTWDFKGGKKIAIDDLIQLVIKAINKNNIQRNLSILGGEPLVEANYPFLIKLLKAVKNVYPTIKIFLWTGYTTEEIKTFLQTSRTQKPLRTIIRSLDVIVTGRFELQKRDVSLKWRGSSNQEVINIPPILTTTNIYNKGVL